MIFDSLKNRALYASDERLSRALEFLAGVTPDITLGRQELDGDRMYANVVEYETKTEGVFEGHRAYADVQFVLSGREDMECVNISHTEPTKEYDAAGDYALFADSALSSRITVNEGEFAVFYPEDIHKPSLASGAAAKVKKVIVKLRLD